MRKHRSGLMHPNADALRFIRNYIRQKKPTTIDATRSFAKEQSIQQVAQEWGVRPSTVRRYWCLVGCKKAANRRLGPEKLSVRRTA